MSHIKCLILAAGYGSRMQPWTHKTPKPLLPFGDLTLLDHAVNHLKSYGVEDIAINSHHLHTELHQYIQTKYPFIKIFHEPKLLGTGGAIAATKSWLDGADLLVYNSDIICDVNIQQLIKHVEQAQNTDITMVLQPNPKQGKNPVYTCETWVTSIGTRLDNQHKPHTFCGIHILKPRFIHTLPDGPSHITDFYQKHLSIQGKISAFYHDSYWFDTGTPAEYFTALCFMIQSHPEILIQDQAAVSQQIYTSAQSICDETAQLDSHVYCFGECRIGEGSFLKNVVLYNTEIMPKQRLLNTLMYDQDSLPIPEPIGL